MNYLQDPNIAYFTQLIIAAACGMLLGIERVLAGRTAGPRTYSLVAIGSCLLTIISQNAAYHYPGLAILKVDPVPIVSNIISGIGFLGAGIIIFQNSKLSGVTTAAGVWVAAAIGITVGFHYYLLALFTTFLTLFIFTIVRTMERQLKKWYAIIEGEEQLE